MRKPPSSDHTDDALTAVTTAVTTSDATISTWAVREGASPAGAVLIAERYCAMSTKRE